MSEQDPGSCVGRGARQRRGRIAALLGVEMVRAEIRDTCDDQRRSIVCQHCMLVEQHGQTETPELRDPRTCPRVVLVVAGDQESPVARAESRQRRRVTPELANRSVNHIAGHRDEIRAQAVHRIYDGINIFPANRMADVHVADLRNGESMQRGRQVPDRDIHVDDARPTPRSRKSNCRRNDSEHYNGHGG